jgi:uncharacterized protein (DUF302 family)
MRKILFAVLFLVPLFITQPLPAADAEYHKPYVLASEESGSVAGMIGNTKEALAAQGFSVAGEYAPYPGAHVIVVTSDALRTGAAKTDTGGYGAVQRIALTEAGGKVQVSYTNPVWMGNMYRMESDMKGVAEKLEAALGRLRDFGTEDKWTAKKLRKYNYMMFMPHFTDQITLAEYGSHQEALAAVERGLAAGKGGTSKIYRVDVSGKEESLFGVRLKEGEGADAAVMEVTDSAALKHTAHLPYELLVSGNKVLMLHGKFRIAQSFPDLTMGTFMKISGAPDGIQDAFQAAVGK